MLNCKGLEYKYYLEPCNLGAREPSAQCCNCHCISDSDCSEGYVCQNSECTPEQNCEDMDCNVIMGGSATREGWEWSCKFYCTQNNISKKYSLTPCQQTYISPSYCCNCICESNSDCYSKAPYCINNEC